MATPKSIIEAVEDSSKQYNALAGVFVVACLYVGIAATSTNHKMLLLGGSLQLPILNTAVPVEGFYFLAPCILVSLHVFFLLQQHLLYVRRRHLRSTYQGEKQEFLLFPSLPIIRRMVPDNEPLVREFLRTALFVVNFTIPFWALCLVQYKFLPYGSFGITLWHQALIVGDLLAAWYFLFLFPSRYPRRRNDKLMRHLAMVAAGVVLLFSLAYAVRPGTWIEWIFGRRNELVADRSLRLPDQSLIAGAPPPELLAVLEANGDSGIPGEKGEEGRKRSERMYLKYTVGAELAERNLSEASLEGATLTNADLRGADLQGASLVGADLRGVHLTPSGDIDNYLLYKARGPGKAESVAQIARERQYKRATLRNAKLKEADFRGGNLILVDLEGADLRGANLLGVELTHANLRKARLQGAHLEGAELSYSNLEGAYLDGAHLEGATLDHALLMNASLVNATGIGASFAEANLAGARMAEARFMAADFRGSSLIGSDLRRAFLQGATTLKLDLLDARGAHLNGACGITWGKLVDLRFVDFQTESDWGMVAKTLKNIPNIPESVEGRIEAAKMRAGSVDSQAICLGVPPVSIGLPAALANRRLLYFDQQRTGAMHNWPSVAEQGPDGWDEQAFQRGLAAELIRHACSKPDLAEALAFRSAGESAPGELSFGLELARQMVPLFQPGIECPGLEQLPRVLKRQIERVSRSFY